VCQCLKKIVGTLLDQKEAEGMAAKSVDELKEIEKQLRQQLSESV